MTGLAPDGGLLLPENIPDVSNELSWWQQLRYNDLAEQVMSRFFEMTPELQALISPSYATFRNAEVAPVVSWDGEPLHVMELFHGPTLAFKDVALQWLGNLFEYILEKQDSHLNIVGATSGDTGSAAIHGVRGKPRINIFIMHPQGRTSPVQERQMTTVLDENVFNLAVEGTFDDCQAIVKEMLGDVQLHRRYNLGAVNSINWARVLAQVVYYFYGVFRVQERTGAPAVDVTVPTGNFGDIFAGYVAMRMGLPIHRLVLAANDNNILERFFTTGEYRRGTVRPTLSPSMDIQIASNFERYLYYRTGCDAQKTAGLMREFASTGSIRMNDGDPAFAAGSAGMDETLGAIRWMKQRYDYIPDPHTAVGIHVARQQLVTDIPMLCLATAHPAKFPDAISQALDDVRAAHPLIDALEGLPVRCETMPADAAAVRRYVIDHAQTGSV